MRVVHKIKELREVVAKARKEGKTIGYQITTGNLHKAHAYLAEVLREHSDFVVVSNMGVANNLIFTKEAFRSPNPSTPDDEKILTPAQVDVLFAPPCAEVYPGGFRNLTEVHVPGVSEGLCNVGRDNYFRYVASMVLKMFNIVQPDVAIFGEKDYQQFAVVRKMARDLSLPIRVISAPVIRYANGLAYASRNEALRSDERARAHYLFEAMDMVRKRIQAGEQDFESAIEGAKAFLIERGLLPDYIQVREPETLAPATPESSSIIVFGAAYLGPDRLVDTLRFKL